MSEVFAKYRVIFTGDTLPGHERDEVLRDLAIMFKSNSKNMESLLQGKTVPLKKEYDRDQAFRICEKIQKLGAACEVEVIDEQSLQLLDEETLSEMDVSDPNKILGADSEIQYGSQVDNDSIQETGLGRDSLFHAVLVFVETNVEYYRNKFQRFGNPRKPAFKLSWHWPAFFFFFLWAMYRKMWLWAALYLIVGVGLMTIANPGIISLIWLFVWPMCANYIYYRHAISGARINHKDSDRPPSMLYQRGVSRIAVWIGIVLCIGLSSLLTRFYTDQFMESYGQYVEDVLPGSGSQIRGDGTAMGNIDSEDGKLNNTSLTLSYLATSLKVILVNQEKSNSSQALDIFIDKLKKNGVHDSWGTPIYMIEQSNRYDLISAGPDGVRKTDDDLIQPIPFVFVQ